MFGFGKKKQDMHKQKVFAGIALEAIHETQKELLEEFDKYLVDNKEANYPSFGTHLFYSSKMPVAEDVVAYILGFIFGVCQSYGRDESDAGAAIFYFGEGYERTTNNYLKVLSLECYSKSFFEVFETAWVSKKYLQDETNGNHFIQGLAEGKDYADVTVEMDQDYSVFKSPETAEKLNLSGFRHIISGWKGQILFSKELMAVIKMPAHWTSNEIDIELRRQGLDPKALA